MKEFLFHYIDSNFGYSVVKILLHPIFPFTISTIRIVNLCHSFCRKPSPTPERRGLEEKVEGDVANGEEGVTEEPETKETEPKVENEEDDETQEQTDSVTIAANGSTEAVETFIKNDKQLENEEKNRDQPEES